MKNTNLVFVLGSGRCGTKAIVKLFSGNSDIEAHHEYCRYAYQREAVLHAMDKIPLKQVMTVFDNIYTSAAYLSQSGIFLDSSHKLAWVTSLLGCMYPMAKFVHLVRDGRKVVSSFYNKLQIHNDIAWGKFLKFANGHESLMPPPSEKFWVSPIPRDVDRFQRVCWHWVDTNRYISDGLKSIPNDRKLLVKLEELTGSKNEIQRLVDFVGIDYIDIMSDIMKRPDHVYVPIDYKLTGEQNKVFETICGETMETYNYNIKKEVYDVNY